MNKRFKAKWIKLLRSGEIPQARTKLKDGSALCCIGVGYKALKGRRPAFDNTDTACHAIGLTGEQQAALVQFNDGKMWEFARIANWIEKNL